MSLPTEAPSGALPLRVRFGGAERGSEADSHSFTVGVPCLAGIVAEEIFPPAKRVGRKGGFQLFEAGDLLIGYAKRSVTGATVEQEASGLYADMLSAATGRHLFRIWNYVPRINEEHEQLENYRSFCRGRSLAFETAWGNEYKRHLPSASAVGCDDDQLAVVFAAGRAEARHVENPEQVPAYEYPSEHGPRAPSFARATLAETPRARYFFISGTAAIKGHATVAPGALDEQIACTLHNLRLVSNAGGVGEDLGLSSGWRRHFKVYLRRAADLAHARELLEGALLRPEDRVTWLRADVCRAALNIEIEATLVSVK